MKTTIITLLTLFALTACGGGSSSSTPRAVQTNDQQTQQETETETDQTTDQLTGTIDSEQVLASNITGIDYPLHIYTPVGYEQNESQLLTFYVTDAQWNFNTFVNLIEDAGVAAILIGIEQGPNNRRETDFLFPGLNDYHRVLVEELLPFAEDNYNIDTDNRVLYGASYGGFMSGHVMLMDDIENPIFKTIISVDASFWVDRPLTTTMLNERYATSDTLDIELILTSASIAGNELAVETFYQELTALNFQGLTVHRLSHTVTHNDSPIPAFTDTLPILFPEIVDTE
ncbi:hypothetical protein HR060_15140 [Catenovulum sp. SM1970]|uniref:alpha/beta hydrolase n=1 Tax=Marinifaba aquimaris TaxID=2741323 RepID=UPI00157230D3|nr:alpha/beta hydrolase-fold protein [Marinifaba aquimaris]NTS78185.1 hypothetical protein [Marinifaba aquimaris]